MFSNTGSLFNDPQGFASIKSDVERQLNRSFKTFDILEQEALKDPENTSYFMKVKTDDNGHVKVKTTKHPAGGEWKTDIQEYNKGSAIGGSQDRNLPLEGQNQFSQGQLGQGQFNQGQSQSHFSQGRLGQGQSQLGQNQFSQGQSQLGQGQFSQGQSQLGQNQFNQGQLGQGQFNQGQSQSHFSQGGLGQGQSQLGQNQFSQGQSQLGQNQFSQGQLGQGQFNQGQLSQGQSQLGQGQSGQSQFNQQQLGTGLSDFGSNLLFDSGFQSWQNFADRIKTDVEKQLNTNFNTFDVLEHEAKKDPEHTSYFMKVKTDDNGHVRVKTTRHPAGGEWKTDVQEYERGALGGRSDRNMPIENRSNPQYQTGNMANP